MLVRWKMELIDAILDMPLGLSTQFGTVSDITEHKKKLNCNYYRYFRVTDNVCQF